MFRCIFNQTELMFIFLMKVLLDLMKMIGILSRIIWITIFQNLIVQLQILNIYVDIIKYLLWM